MKITCVADQADELLKFCAEFGVEQVTVDVRADLPNIQKVIDSPFWPVAVSDNMIVADEEGKRLRASSILMTLIGQRQLGRGAFLDFGCGDGHTIREAAKYTDQVCGYDPERDFGNSSTLTNRIETIKSKAPFKTILCYDVLDHIAAGGERTQALKTMKSLLAPGGVIYLRTHPYTSRHAAHVYEKFNKAYIHLFLTNEQLAARGLSPATTAFVKRPIRDYTQMVQHAGLRVASQDVIKQSVEPMFEDPDVARWLIDRHWRGDDFVTTPQALVGVLSIQFIDFVLVSA